VFAEPIVDDESMLEGWTRYLEIQCTDQGGKKFKKFVLLDDKNAQRELEVIVAFEHKAGDR
jgi:hypothetical protein